MVPDAKTISGLLLEKVDSNRIASNILKHAAESKNEEDLKIRVEDELRGILKEWGIQWASYEHRLKISGREDSLYGTVIIEYKTPGRLDSKAEYSKAKEQIKDYIRQEGGDESKYGKYFGVVMDGYKIAFVRYRKNEWLEQAEPLQVNGQTILRLLESIRGLRRKPIDAEQLLLDFGPRSEISRKAILVLYNALVDKNSARTDMLFNDWRRVFSQVCSYSSDKLTGLVDFYGLKSDKKVDVEKLLFAIHTYYTLLMKLLTSEIVTLFADSLLGSYLKRIEEAYFRSKDELLVELKDLEEGGIFSSLGIRNFLEADYFGWYLDEWNVEIATAVYNISKRLLDYEPATVELNPERVKDLFKRLYQNLVPRDIRHSIGEYFTPDWLADLVLDEVGYDGNPDKRVLDPACGSGTFIVLTIRRIRDYGEEHFVDRRELLAKITSNVRGIDLNPLAVLASKANYLVALSDLLRYRPREGIDIPVYLADSISVVRRVTPYGEDEFELQTNEGKFWVTKEVIDKNVLNPVLSIVSEGVKVGLTKQQFELALSKDIPLRQDSVQSLVRLYDKILNLERYGKNRIWTSLLKNSFSPMLLGKFDYVIGNPPWINWESLPEYYRNSTKGLWDQYGLLGKTKGMGLGKTKRDISMLFVARCFEQYVESTGKLGFLVPFTPFKTQTGAGFRKWVSSNTRMARAHDLVELYPFEGAVNRTAMIVLQTGKTTFPVQCTVWTGAPKGGIEMKEDLTEVKRATRHFDLILAPVTKNEADSPWMLVSQKSYETLQRVIRPSEYRASAGLVTALNGVFWVDVLPAPGGNIIVRNLNDVGKKKVREVTLPAESDLVYPLARGRDHKKWFVKPESYVIVPSGLNGAELSYDEIKTKYPQTYTYFIKFFDDLVHRGGEPYKTRLRAFTPLSPYAPSKLARIEKVTPPFYYIFNAKWALSPYKVCWKEIAGKISGKGLFSAAVVGPSEDAKVGRKTAVLDHKLMFIPLNVEDEAHYVAAVLNSTISQLIVSGYTVETTMDTHIMNHVYVPKFDSENELHGNLADLSKKAHGLAKDTARSKDKESSVKLQVVEKRIDELVAELFGVTKEELHEMTLMLDTLVGEAENAVN